MASLPAPLRATLGLLATALDTVQELVERAPEIPMEAVGNSMQLSLRLQQHYVALVNRGDELIAGLRGAPDEPPAWATFDDGPASAAHDGTDLPDAVRQEEPRQAGQGDPLLTAATGTGASTSAEDDLVGDTTSPTEEAAPGKKATRAKKAAPAGDTTATKQPAAAKKAAPAKRTTAAKKTTTANRTATAKKITATKKTAPAKAAASARKTVAATPASADGAQAAAIAPATRSSRAVAPADKTPRRSSAKRAAAGTTAPTRAGRKRASATRLATKVAASPVVTAAPPELDADLGLGGASARPVSAFDRADAGPDHPDTTAAAETQPAVNAQDAPDTDPVAGAAADETPPDSTS